MTMRAELQGGQPAEEKERRAGKEKERKGEQCIAGKMRQPNLKQLLKVLHDYYFAEVGPIQINMPCEKNLTGFSYFIKKKLVAIGKG